MLPSKKLIYPATRRKVKRAISIAGLRLNF